MLAERVRNKLETLSTDPGVYLFRDRNGKVLYIGKATSLRSRVRSYFQASTTDTRYFIERLGGEIDDLETFVVNTEKEAALLENTLIKEHKPRYNVKLRDDKDYLSLKLDPRAEWPRLEVVRRPKPDGALYFGPYHSATSARQTLRLINRHFQLRTCTDSEFNMRTRPCLQYQIKRCPGPCVLPVNRNAYEEQIRNVALFLQGRHDELITQLKDQMKRASQVMDYEHAAIIRDQLHAVEAVREDQHVAMVKNVDQDVVGFYRQADQVEIVLLHIREGKLSSVNSYELSNALPDDELIASFVNEYYKRDSFIPKDVLLPNPIEAMSGLSDVLTERRGAKVEVMAPKRGPRAALVRLAMQNARHAYEEKSRAKIDIERRLAVLQNLLSLPKMPERIECIDISHSSGTDTVGALVTIAHGQPATSKYRAFHVKRAAESDDYGAMYEVLSRRFKRGRENQAGWEMPDLLVVDGGRGQLNVALAVLKDLGVNIPVVSLAKEKDTMQGGHVTDRLFVPERKNPIVLRDNSPALYLLALARDEAHRVSNRFRERLGKRRSFASSMDLIAGVGPKTRTRLLRKLGSVKAISEATEATLIQAGATQKQARAIYAALHRKQAQPQPTGLDSAVELEQTAVDNAFN